MAHKNSILTEIRTTAKEQWGIMPNVDKSGQGRGGIFANFMQTFFLDKPEQHPNLVRFLMTGGVVDRRCRASAPAAEQHGVHRGFKRREWVVHADHLGDEVEVDEEKNDSEEDEGEWRRHEEDAAHLQQEDQRRDKARFDLTENTDTKYHQTYRKTSDTPTPIILPYMGYFGVVLVTVVLDSYTKY